MPQLNGSIGFIGSGNMAEAMIGALINSALIAANRIFASDINPERLEALSRTYGIAPVEDNNQLFSTCDTLVLAVKPQVMDTVLGTLADFLTHNPPASRKLVISIAAGYPIKNIEKHLYGKCNPEQRPNMPIVRVMPNTPALVLAGMAGMSGNQHTTEQDLQITRTILSAMGEVLEFPESDLDAVTALSGSGPAYIFYLAETMIDAGIALGIDPASAKQLSLTTMRGAIKLMDTSQESPEDLRHKVTSPGGTTEAAFKVLTQNMVKENIIQAIKAAAQRSRELSQ